MFWGMHGVGFLWWFVNLVGELGVCSSTWLVYVVACMGDCVL